MTGKRWFAAWIAVWVVGGSALSKDVAYIHGDVAANGDTPSGEDVEAYDPMLLTDTGRTGMSEFKLLVESQGYTITQHYDQETTLNAAFLGQFDVIVFGLHQKVWPPADQAALDAWIRGGGGILMYSDSAAGGLFSQVGIKNPIGQNAVNSILSNYGMQVTVDQGQGTRGYEPDEHSPHPVLWDQPVLEGEGVSPVAVDPASDAVALIPLLPANRVSNNNDLNIDARNITIANPVWAVLAEAKVGLGHVMAIFDRQPLWNNGPGSDIDEEDNREVLRRIVRYLARDYGNSLEWFGFELHAAAPPMLEVSFREWSGGVGSRGFDYIARNNRFALEQQAGLLAPDWRREVGLVEEVSVSVVDAESERVQLRLHPDVDVPSWFARLSIQPQVPPVVPTVDAGDDLVIAAVGSAWLEASATNANSQLWSKVSGPGTVGFANDSALQTTASFSTPGTYELQLTVFSADTSASDTLAVTVVEGDDVVAAINCGGGTYSGSNGFNYAADSFFDGGGIDNFPGNAVAGTHEDVLYNTARSKPSFAGYSIPVTNGNYLVYFQFAETFFTDNNRRVFDLSIEGSLVLDDVDLHAVAPGKWVAYRRAFTTTVADGMLDIDVSASVNNPLVNAIVVIELP